jgi:UDP-glucose 4-epimerase
MIGLPKRLIFPGISSMPHRTALKPNVLITGGAGFIGTHLARVLVRRGFRVTILDNLYRGSLENLSDSMHALRFVKADIRDRDSIGRWLEGVSVVFHLAAQSNVIGSVADVDYCMSANIGGTTSVLQAARAGGVRRIVFASSREVYGDPASLPVPEAAPLQPKNAYGMSKLAGEMCCRMAAADGLEAVILRITNVYGPGDSGRVVPTFIENALRGLPLVLYGGEQVVDFVPVHAVVSAMIKAAFGPYVREPVNIGSGQGTRVVDLARRVLRLTGSPSELRFMPRREVEVRGFIAETDKAASLLGFTYRKAALAALRSVVARSVERPVLRACG